jgi:hypothetical protein
MELVQELDRRVSQTREAAALQELKEDLEFANSLAVGGLIVSAAASTTRRLLAAFSIMGTYGIINKP